MTGEWGRKLAALFLAAFAIATLAAGMQPSACGDFGAHVPYCAAETLSMPASVTGIPAAVLPALNSLVFAFLAIVFFASLRDNGRMRLALLRRTAPDVGPWTHRHRNHLAPLASPHGD